MDGLAEFLRKIEAVRKQTRSYEGKQIFSKEICGRLRALSGEFYSDIRPTLNFEEAAFAPANKAFDMLHELSHKSPSRQKVIDALNEAKRAIVALEGNTFRSIGAENKVQLSPTDLIVIQTLDEMCPPAAVCYRQALADMVSPARESWRGVAAEFREALRETLDQLAPDNDVEAAENYKPEGNATRPTMKQKVRFILRNRKVSGTQIATTEESLKFVEESMGGLTRSVYNRSSVSAHTPSSRQEVERIHALVRIMLCEILAIRHQ